jgi:hypothetical protein
MGTPLSKWQTDEMRGYRDAAGHVIAKPEPVAFLKRKALRQKVLRVGFGFF